MAKTPLGDHLLSCGFETSHDYLKANDGKTYIEASEGTGFPAIALINLARNECKTDQDHNWFLRDSLARKILSICAEGWKTGPRGDSVAAHAVAAWVSIVEPLGEVWAEHAERCSRNLFRSERVPVGWRPSGASDPIVADFIGAPDSPPLLM